MKEHTYTAQIQWTGDQGVGTLNYKSYGRDHIISIPGKYEVIQATADPSFRGDPAKYNPEELFVSSIASCHMLWYLHLCAVNNIIVTSYEDNPVGIMEEATDGSGKITQLTLRPTVQITLSENINKAKALHEDAHKMCFLAQSCNFPIRIEPTIEVE